MTNSPCILAVVPPSCERSPAVRRAAELARRAGGTLHLHAFVHDGLIEAAGLLNHDEVALRARHDFVNEHAARLRALAVELAGGGCDVDCDVVWARVPHEAIVSKALELGAGLVVKDVRHDARMLRVLTTPVDLALARLLPCGLMLVRPDSPSCPKRVLASVDVLSERAPGEPSLNDCVVQAARAVAEYAGASLEIVSVAPWLPLDPRSAMHATARYDQTVMHHLKTFQAFVEAHCIPGDCCHRLVGVPVECIGDLVEREKFDLLVVGNVYRNAWERLLLGSTAEVLAQRAHCDLLVVKQPGFARELERRLDLGRIARELALERPQPSEVT